METPLIVPRTRLEGVIFSPHRKVLNSELEQNPKDHFDDSKPQT
jgi:hypothetical protein